MPSTTDEVQPSSGIFSLFKGAGGSGKSTASLSFPTPYVLDFDRKMPTIAKKHFPGKKIDWDVFADVWALDTKIRELEYNCPYETIIADTFTSASTLCLNSLAKTKGENVIKMLATLQKAKAGKEAQVDTMGFDYYKGEMAFFERYLLEKLRILWARPGRPKHVLCLAHLVTTEQTNILTNTITKTTSIVTAGNKCAAYIPTRFDEEYVFGFKVPSLGDSLSKAKNVVSMRANTESNARTAFNFPDEIDFTNKSFFDELCKSHPELAEPSPEIEKAKSLSL